MNPDKAHPKGGDRQTKARPKLMEDSGQTEEERRVIRSKQRQIREEIIFKAPEIAKLNSSHFKDITDENHRVFKEVCYPREAVNDQENLRLITEQAAKQVDCITMSKAYDADRFVAKLRERGTPQQRGATFNWPLLGKAVGVYFRCIPPVSFMLGPVGKPEKPKAARKQREKVLNQVAKEVRPDVIRKTQPGGRQLDPTQARILDMQNALKRKREETKSSAPLDMMEVLVDPSSFTQTVENIFDFSFLVKSGDGSLTLEPNSGLPRVNLERPDENPLPSQMVASITMKDWRELIAVYGLKGPGLLHRPTGEGTDYYDPLNLKEKDGASSSA